RRVRLYQPVQTARLRLDATGGERRRELRLQRGVRAAEVRPLLIRAVEAQVELQHGEVHEDDACEQRGADDDPEDCAVRTGAAARTRPRARLRLRRPPRARRRDDGGCGRLSQASPPRASAPTATAGYVQPRRRTDGSRAAASPAASARRRTRRRGTPAGRYSRAPLRAGTAS